MKSLIVVAATLVATSAAWAQTPAATPPDAGKFEAHKTKMLERISARMDHMQKAKSCIEAASDKDAMKACHKERREGKKGSYHKS